MRCKRTRVFHFAATFYCRIQLFVTKMVKWYTFLKEKMVVNLSTNDWTREKKKRNISTVHISSNGFNIWWTWTLSLTAIILSIYISHEIGCVYHSVCLPNGPKHFRTGINTVDHEFLYMKILFGGKRETKAKLQKLAHSVKYIYSRWVSD